MISLLDLCEESEKAPGAQVGMRWWEKAGINMVGAREAAAARNDGGEERRRRLKGRLLVWINSKEYT